MIRFSCPGCGKKLGIPDTLAGRVAACPQCKHKFRVPRPEAEDPVEADERVAATPPPTPPRPAPSAKIRRPAEDEDGPPVKRPRRPVGEDEDEEVGRPVRRPRSIRRDEDDDEEERPVRRARERRRDEGDEDEPARPARRRKKKRRREQAAGLMGLSPLVLGAIGVFGICLLLAIVSFFVPVLAIVPMALGWLMMFAGGIWFLVVAFQDEVMAGVLCLVIPFYSLYYLITHFDTEMKPFAVQVAGTVLMFLGSFAGGLGAVRDVNPEQLHVPPPPARWAAEVRSAV